MLHDGGRGPRDPAVTSALVLAAATGGAGVAAARDLGSWLVTLELATLPLVALVALRGTRAASHGALTLLVTSLTSFALLVLGSALWLTATGDAAFAADSVATAWGDPQRRAVLVLGVVVLLAGLGFKLSLVPFHAWTPQAYSTADLGTTVALAAASKLSALAALLVVVQALVGPVVDARGVTVVVGVLAVASMLLGNVMALRQDDVTRLLAWSTVAQAGWVVLPVAALTDDGARAAAAYVLVYAVATVVAFAAVALVGAGAPRPVPRAAAHRPPHRRSAGPRPARPRGAAARRHRARREGGRPAAGGRRRAVAARRRRRPRRRRRHRRLPPVVRRPPRRAGRHRSARGVAGGARPRRPSRAGPRQVVLVTGTVVLVLLSALPALLSACSADPLSR